MPSTACPIVVKSKTQQGKIKCKVLKLRESRVLAGKDFTYAKSVACSFGNLIYLTTSPFLSLLIDILSKHGDTIFNKMSRLYPQLSTLKIQNFYLLAKHIINCWYRGKGS